MGAAVRQARMASTCETGTEESLVADDAAFRMSKNALPTPTYRSISKHITYHVNM